MICVSIQAPDTERALLEMQHGFSVAQTVELRLDFMARADLGALLRRKAGQVIVTVRRKEEGGAFRGKERERIELLKEAVREGADYLDLEVSTSRTYVEEVLREINHYGCSCKLILSKHYWKGTPGLRILRGAVKRCLDLGAQIPKIVTMAHEKKDNLVVLRLMDWANSMGVPLISFCMGELGVPSRVMAPILGAPFTYACLSKGSETAPGQIPAAEMGRILEVLGGRT